MAAHLWSIPNIVTYLRVLLIPVVMGLAQDPSVTWSRWAALAFGIAAVTDAIDGYLARRWHLVSWVGELLDPLADKLLVIGTLMALLPQGRIPVWLVFALLAREMLINGLRSIAAGAGVIIAAGSLGKLKTVVQMVGVGCLLIREPPLVETVGMGLVWVSLGLSYGSALQYLVVFQRKLQNR